MTLEEKYKQIRSTMPIQPKGFMASWWFLMGVLGAHRQNYFVKRRVE